jgi:hypothetical protein
MQGCFIYLRSLSNLLTDMHMSHNSAQDYSHLNVQKYSTVNAFIIIAVGNIYSMLKRDEKCLQSFKQKTWREEVTMRMQA